MSDDSKNTEACHVNMAYTGDGGATGKDYGTGIASVASAEDPKRPASVASVKDDGGDEREAWGNQCDFFLSALGYAVGLGNIWRFPMRAYEYGGGSFLIPYVIMLLLAGLPLFFMELALGQYSGAGPTRVFGRLAPAFKGLGFSMLVATFFVAIYYNVIIAWTIHYIFAGMTSELPWVGCDHDWNTPQCTENPNVNVSGEGLVFKNATFSFDNTSKDESIQGAVSPPEDYFNTVVLGYDPNFNNWVEYGTIQWQLVGCLAAAWTIVCLSLVKGVESSGKVVYFTAIFPFVVLFILFWQAVFLPGSYEGVLYYVTPKWEVLLHSDVWRDAASQIFFSLGPAFGGLITLSSYNRFDNNCHRDAILIAFSNCATSVFAGFVVFSILGFMAHTAGLSVDQVVKGGPALAFVAFPDAISQMSIPWFWSFLLFVMFLTLGLDSMFTLVETLTTAMLDHFKSLHRHKEMVVVSICAMGFLFGLSMVCSSGVLMLTLIDSTCAAWNLLLFAFLEVILVSWIYGVDNFLANIEEMGMKLGPVMYWYWKITWSGATPLVLLVLVVWDLAASSPVMYAEVEFPAGIQSLGSLISWSSVIFLPILVVRQWLRRKAKGKPLGMAMFKPTPRWKPAKKS